MIPYIKGLTEPKETGIDAFAKLSAAEQEQILGKAKSAAYRDGTLSLANLVGVQSHPRWGKTRYEKSLADALRSASPPPPFTLQPFVPKPRTPLERLATFANVQDVTVKYRPTAKEKIRDLFGRDLFDQQLAAAAGALDGAKLDVGVSGSKLAIAIAHPHIESQVRYIYRNPQGQLVIKNEIFAVEKGAPKGIGIRSFAREVAGARLLGITKIETYAAGEYGNSEWNGYYTWPRFGYDAPLSSFEQEQANRVAKYRGAKTVLELMRKDGGIEVWKRNGTGRPMEFLLDGRSISMRTLLKYLQEKELL